MKTKRKHARKLVNTDYTVIQYLLMNVTNAQTIKNRTIKQNYNWIYMYEYTVCKKI